ncbi:MAG: multicopper oxidase domain-containing protein [Solirubrobacterales bacterium]
MCAGGARCDAGRKDPCSAHRPSAASQSRPAILPYPRRSRGKASVRPADPDTQFTGEFVYHCHILAHEDSEMMGLIKVSAPGGDGKHAGHAMHEEPSESASVSMSRP